MPRAYRKLKLRYLEIFRRCYWCKRLCKDYPLIAPHSKLPDDAATIDHVISRYKRKKGDHVRKVLACNKCNQDRSEKETKELNNKL